MKAVENLVNGRYLYEMCSLWRIIANKFLFRSSIINLGRQASGRSSSSTHGIRSQELYCQKPEVIQRHRTILKYILTSVLVEESLTLFAHLYSFPCLVSNLKNSLYIWNGCAHFLQMHKLACMSYCWIELKARFTDNNYTYNMATTCMW